MCLFKALKFILLFKALKFHCYNYNTLFFYLCMIFFFTDCVIRSSSVCLNFFQGRALVENILEYVRILSDSYSRSHTLPREEPIQVRSPSLYFTFNRDYPEGFAGRDLHCGLGVANPPKDFGQLDLLMEGINPPCLLSMLWYSHNFKRLLLSLNLSPCKPQYTDTNFPQ